ncbi:MAG: hypothetical protein EHM20_14505, partial [Alphaproteobacteria bacterium]
MNSKNIIKYWIPSKAYFDLKEISTNSESITPVILMGGRGTGKTMFLRFMSTEIQLDSRSARGEDIKSYIDKESYLGVYYRFDGPCLSAFQNSNLSETQWQTIFKHYFELVIGAKYIDLLQILEKNGLLNLDRNLKKEIIFDIQKKIVVSTEYIHDNKLTFEYTFEIMQEMVNYVSRFINEVPIARNPEFKSRPIMPGKELIFGIPEILVKKIPCLENKKIIVLLDEYENLLLPQQKLINTLVKHVQFPVTFYIGTRINGLKTYDTLNKGEFLAEDADYRQILFEDILSASKKEYKDFLKEIAQKRLEEIPEFRNKGLIHIDEILGNLDFTEEAKIVVFDRSSIGSEISIEDYKKKRHVEEILKELKERGKYSESQLNEIIENLVCPENPLLDMLNLLLLRRGDKIEYVSKIFTIYLNGEKENPEFKKYLDLYEKNKMGLLIQLIG